MMAGPPTGAGNFQLRTAPTMQLSTELERIVEVSTAAAVTVPVTAIEILIVTRPLRSESSILPRSVQRWISVRWLLTSDWVLAVSMPPAAGAGLAASAAGAPGRTFGAAAAGAASGLGVTIAGAGAGGSGFGAVASG